MRCVGLLLTIPPTHGTAPFNPEGEKDVAAGIGFAYFVYLGLERPVPAFQSSKVLVPMLIHQRVGSKPTVGWR